MSCGLACSSAPVPEAPRVVSDGSVSIGARGGIEADAHAGQCCRSGFGKRGNGRSASNRFHSRSSARQTGIVCDCESCTVSSRGCVRVGCCGARPGDAVAEVPRVAVDGTVGV